MEPDTVTSIHAAHRLAARLADLNLEPETLELVLAALTSDVNDDGASPPPARGRSSGRGAVPQ